MTHRVDVDHSAELMGVLNSSINEIYIFKQNDLKFIWVNEGALRNTQYSFEQMSQLTPLSLKPAYDHEAFQQIIEPLNSGKQKIVFETFHQRKNGTHYCVEVHLEMGTFQNQAVYIAVILDISDRVSQEKAIAEFEKNERSLSNVLFQSQNEIYIFYLDTLNFAWVNLKAVGNMGYSQDELYAMTPLDIKPRFTKEKFMLMLKPLVSGVKQKIKFQAIHRRKDGSEYDVEVHLQLERFNQKPAFVAIILDVSKRIQQETLINDYLKQKTYQANHDAVTELPNRRALSGDISARLSGEITQDMAVVFIDLDEFKDINDTLGHNLGDMLLIEVSRRLSQLKGAGDYLIRFGGDEFLFLICDQEKLDNIEMFCEDVMAVLNKPFQLQANTRSITASIGVSRLSNPTRVPFDDTMLNVLIQHADYALFWVKKIGKNNYYIFDDELERQLEKRTYYLSKFNHDIELDKFELNFQPILQLSTKKVVGAEVLLRWRPEGQLISPIEFIPLLEETGQICSVGNWVLARMYQLISQQRHQLPETFKICFNASVVQLASHTFYEVLEKYAPLFDQLDVELEMEITESVFAADMMEVQDIVNNIQLLGVKISVDDFGTGFSCLEYLRILPIDTLKIDKRFIDDCLDKKGFGILQSIVTLAASLDLGIIAEGIETQQQLRCLSSLESIFPQLSIHGQGFLFHRPMLFDQFISNK